MTCRYCGTALPDGALFCGECGQPVAASASDDAPTGASAIVAAARSVRDSGGSGATGAVRVIVAESDETAHPSTGFSIADLAFSSPGETSQPDDDDRDLPDGSPPAGSPRDHGDASEPASHCPQCGEPMAKGDVFCGECGFVLRTVTPPSGINLITLGEFPADPDEPASEIVARDADATTEVERLSDASAADDDDAADDDGDDAAGDDDDADDDAADDSFVDAEEMDQLIVEPAAGFAPPEPEADPDLEFDDPLPFSEPEARSVAKGSPRSRPIPDPFPWGTDQPLREDLEATRLVADSATGTRYVLQFSTGESVTVAGSGLIGRNPSMQPGEYVDQLVPIFDAGKSVSKTHLEFGQEAGRFWVSDRYSTNGSVIRQPDAEPRRCDAGRRYFIARGTRVDVGEQFFVVS